MATPRFRPSYTMPQLQAIKEAIAFYESQHDMMPIAMVEVSQSIQLFLAKINMGLKAPAYTTQETVRTGYRVNAADLGEPAPLPETAKTEPLTIEECKEAAKTYLTNYKPFIMLGQELTVPANIMEGWKGWESYCKENDLDAETEAWEN